MNKKTVARIFMIVAVSLFLLVSCNDSKKPGGFEDIEAIEALDSDASVDLASLEFGQTLRIRLGAGRNVNLDGAGLASLCTVELEGSANSRSKGMGNGVLSKVEPHGNQKTNDIYNVVPQEDEKSSFSGSDVGIQDDGVVRITKLGNGLESGENYVQFKIKPTSLDYEEAGIEQHLWPTYQNYIRMDLNSEEWSKYKGEKVSIVQYAFHDSLEKSSSGGRYSDEFGLVENDGITYSSEIQGLYDLTGKDYLNLYTFFRTSSYEGDSEYLRTYLLIPETVSSTPSKIEGYPHVYKFQPHDEKKGYEIRITDIPEAAFTALVSGLLQGRARFIGDGNNGKKIGELLYVKDIAQEKNGTCSVVFFFSGVGKPFILNSYWREKTSITEFGSISFVESTDNEWTPSYVNVDDSSVKDVTLGGDNKLYHIVEYSIPEGGKEYTLTSSVKNGKLSQLFNSNKSSGSGGQSITLHPGETGYIVYYTLDPKGCEFSYSITANN